MLQATGIGPALRKARLLRGKSIEEASRETRIRADYLQALERERFDALLGDVYVRGFLRSYSTYLGLDADKVLRVYNRTFGGLAPTLPEPAPTPARMPTQPHPHLTDVFRHHPSWAFLVALAVLAVSVFAAAGWFSRSRPAPASDRLLFSPAVIPTAPKTVTVSILATRPVRAVVRIDGDIAFPTGPQTGEIRQGEALSFEGEELIELELEAGGVAVITVNGRSIGRPGSPDRPLKVSFGPKDNREGSSASSP